MKNKSINLIILILAISCLVIMSYVFYNISIFIDEHNLSMSYVLGGYIWQALYWVMGLLTLGICGLSIISLIKRN